MAESYISIRIEPVNAVKYSGHLAEARRHKVPSYVDHAKVKLNQHTVEHTSAEELREYIEQLRKETGQQTLRKDARLAFSGIITFSHEAQPIFDALPVQKQKELYKEIAEELAKKHDTRLLSISLHADETAPHAHFMLCAYAKNGKALRLNPKDTSELQDIAGAVLERNGIKITRGKKICQRIAEARETGETANIKHKSVSELHATMSTDLKKAKNKVKTFIDFSVIKKINPMNFLERLGYVKNKKESSNVSAKYENGHDIIIVKQAKSGDYVYFNATDDRDCGTIVDFCKNRNIDIKQAFITQENETMTKPSIRELYNLAITTTKNRVEQLANFQELANKNYPKFFDKEFTDMANYDLPYLTKTRGIEPAIIREFGVKKDDRGNACFPHYNIYDKKITGWEVKNDNFTGFNSSGTRNLGIAKIGDKLGSLIICESFIDAMSYHKLHNTPANALYVSTGGTFTPEQINQLKTLMDDYYHKEIIIAVDKDEAGEKYAQKLEAIAVEVKATHCIRVQPLSTKDWNEELLHQRERARTAAGPR